MWVCVSVCGCVFVCMSPLFKSGVGGVGGVGSVGGGNYSPILKSWQLCRCVYGEERQDK